MKVDSHVHAAAEWFEPVEVLIQQMDRNGIDKAVLIQGAGEFDNTYLLESASRFPDRLTAVAAVDHTVPLAADEIKRLADAGVAGLRLRSEARSPGQDPFLIWRTAADAGLAVSCLGSAENLTSPDFTSLLEAVPGLSIALEHLGERRRDNPAFTPVKARNLYRTIKPYPNVRVKIHGLAEGNAREGHSREFPFAPGAADVLLCAYDELGADRLMWGSDFPNSSGREGYTNTMRYPRHALRQHGMTPQEEALIFGGVADSVFGRP